VPRGHIPTLGLAAAARHGTFGHVRDPIVAAALARPGAPDESTVKAAGIRFHVLSWGDPNAPPVLMLHGVTSNARTWWRVGPGIAAAGYRVVAPDMPGHGRTGHWLGHVSFRDNAADLAALARAVFPGRDSSDVRVVGHSWGAMTAAALPSAGYVPARLVLLDPPTIPLESIRQMLVDPTERRYDDIDEAIGVVGRLNPTYGYADVVANAEALTQFDEPAVRAILTENGDYDGGLAALADPAARDVAVRLIRGDPDWGGLVPDSAMPAFIARLGEENVATITNGPHSPQRTNHAETAEAILRALR
jgi:pimeloyl-ACP methyl ester carboxylesterase